VQVGADSLLSLFPASVDRGPVWSDRGKPGVGTPGIVAGGVTASAAGGTERRIGRPSVGGLNPNASGYCP
jgi:hypothetical protein